MDQTILTVTAQAVTNDLTRLDTVKEELGVEDTRHDKLLKRWITEESRHIESWLGRPCGTASYSEAVRPGPRQPGSPLPIALKRWPVQDFASITDVDGTVLGTTQFESDLETGFVWRLDDEGLLRRMNWRHGIVTIAYTAGWTLLANLPRPIEMACVTLIKHRWATRDRDPYLRSEEAVGIERLEYWVGPMGADGALAPEVEALLDPYRVPRV